MNNRHGLRNQGFTLLEVMVAVAILAMALASLFASQSASVGMAAESRFKIQAPLLARQKLAEITTENDFISGEGEFEGDFDGFRWELTAEEFLFDNVEIFEKLELKLWHIKLTVRWGDDPVFSYYLETYRQIKSEGQ